YCFSPTTSSFSFQYSCAHRDLHSFPTRRSSDLTTLELRVSFRRWPVIAQHLFIFQTAQEFEFAKLLRLEPAGRFELPAKSQKMRSEEHTSELQSPYDLVCRLLLEKKKKKQKTNK